MSFRPRWPDDLRAAMIHAALHEGRSGAQVHRMAHEGAFPGIAPAAIPLTTVQAILGRARREREAIELAQADPAAVLDEAAGIIVQGVRRDTERYRRRLKMGKTKPGEAAALARDVEGAAKLLRTLHEPKRSPGRKAPDEQPAPDDFVGALAAGGNGRA